MNAYPARIAQMSALVASFDSHREVFTTNPRSGNLLRDAAGAAAGAAYVLVKSGIPAANYLKLHDGIRALLTKYRVGVVTKSILDKIVVRNGRTEGCYTVDLDLSLGDEDLNGMVKNLSYKTCNAVKLAIDKMPADSMVPIDRAVMYLAIKHGLVFYRVRVVRQHLVNLLGGSNGIKAIRKRFLEKIFMAMGKDQMFGFEMPEIAKSTPEGSTAPKAGLTLVVLTDRSGKSLATLVASSSGQEPHVV